MTTVRGRRAPAPPRGQRRTQRYAAACERASFRVSSRAECDEVCAKYINPPPQGVFLSKGVEVGYCTSSALNPIQPGPIRLNGIDCHDAATTDVRPVFFDDAPGPRL